MFAWGSRGENQQQTLRVLWIFASKVPNMIIPIEYPMKSPALSAGLL